MSKETPANSSSRGLIPVDYLVLGYLILTSTLFIVSDCAASCRIVWLGFNAAAAVLVLILRRIDLRASGRGVRWLRKYYPVLLFTFFYEQTQPLIDAFSSGWLDAQVVEFEIELLGLQPSLVVERYFSPLLNDVIIGCYVSYYLWLPVGLLYFLIRSDENTADQVLTAATIVFFISYATFVLYPVEGPRYHLAGLFERDMVGYIFVPLVGQIMDTAAVHGGAMPSSHTATALIVLVGLFRRSRRLGILLLPVFLGLMIGCVWGRFHYVSDVAVGIAIAILAECLTRLIFARGWLGARRLL